MIFIDLSRGRSSAELTQEVERYLLEVRDVCEDIPVILVGSKSDLVDQEEVVQLYNTTSHLDIQRYYTISSLNMVNINTVLDALVDVME